MTRLLKKGEIFFSGYVSRSLLEEALSLISKTVKAMLIWWQIYHDREKVYVSSD